MKLIHNIHIAIFVLIFSIIIFGVALFHYNLSGVSSSDELKEVVIEPGNISSIADTLYQEHLIKSKFIFKIYVYLTNHKNMKAATYFLSENMGVKKIVKLLEEGVGSNSNQISITFKEGINMRTIAKEIANATNRTEEEVYSTLNDTEYLKTLINQYWFLESDILNENIYYSLEGYLYPNTYYFSSKDVTVKEILEIMLEETAKQLDAYKEEITSQSRSFHEVLTLASIVELEGVTLDDRKKIVGVFLNRLNANMNLGSDVTTYYGEKINMGDRDLTKEEINKCNNYNTRCANFVQLPVSPICNPSIESIIAVLEPTESDYYYFVADKNKKIYFSKTIGEHNNKINQLIADGLWYEY